MTRFVHLYLVDVKSNRVCVKFNYVAFFQVGKKGHWLSLKIIHKAVFLSLVCVQLSQSCIGVSYQTLLCLKSITFIFFLQFLFV